MRYSQFLIIFILLSMAFAGIFFAANVIYPKPSGFVNDYANIMDDQHKASINNMISDFEKNSTVEIAVLTVPDLQGLDIETYAVEIFKEWGIGKKKENNGVLILVGLQERKIRIEVGYGLEGVLTDIASKDIIDNIMAPEFKEGKYGDGLYKGVSAIIKTIKNGNYKSSSSPSFNKTSDFFVLCFGSLAIFAILMFIFIKIGKDTGNINAYHSYGSYGSGYYGGYNSRSWSSGGSSWGGFSGGISGGGGASGGW